jgi:uncharacterized protein YoaH (UPF0181 family)
MLRMLEAKQHSEMQPNAAESHQDLMAQNMAMGKAAALISIPEVKAAAHAKKEKEKRLPAGLYRLLNHDVLEGKQNWMPRMMPGEHTPAKDMLADPLRSGILSSLLGAGVGGAVGGLGGSCRPFWHRSGRTKGGRLFLRARSFQPRVYRKRITG